VLIEGHDELVEVPSRLPDRIPARICFVGDVERVIQQVQTTLDVLESFAQHCNHYVLAVQHLVGQSPIVPHTRLMTHPHQNDNPCLLPELCYHDGLHWSSAFNRDACLGIQRTCVPVALLDNFPLNHLYQEELEEVNKHHLEIFNTVL
jgi:hypothetical protein